MKSQVNTSIFVAVVAACFACTPPASVVSDLNSELQCVEDAVAGGATSVPAVASKCAIPTAQIAADLVEIALADLAKAGKSPSSAQTDALKVSIDTARYMIP